MAAILLLQQMLTSPLTIDAYAIILKCVHVHITRMVTLELPVELRHVRYFLAVAGERNFTRAAEKLGIGQPPVSQQIRDLEDELGTPLFHRVPHGAELTEAGEAFLIEARSILAGAERAKLAAQRAHRGQSGMLSLGLSGTAAFNPLVAGSMQLFRRRWPDVLLTLDEMNTMRLVERLASGELDAAFVRPGVRDIEGIRLHRLDDEPMAVALPARHRLARSSKLELKALAQEPFILFPPGLCFTHEVIAACRMNGFDPVVGQVVPQITSALSLVAAELGVSVVPASIKQLQVQGVTYQPIHGLAPVARLALAVRRDSRQIVVQNFIHALRSAANESDSQPRELSASFAFA
jgi:DNA-binding transcriptional LysR family regulator